MLNFKSAKCDALQHMQWTLPVVFWPFMQQKASLESVRQTTTVSLISMKKLHLLSILQTARVRSPRFLSSKPSMFQVMRRTLGEGGVWPSDSSALAARLVPEDVWGMDTLPRGGESALRFLDLSSLPPSAGVDWPLSKNRLTASCSERLIIKTRNERVIHWNVLNKSANSIWLTEKWCKTSQTF